MSGADSLAVAREAYERWAWVDAFEALTAADVHEALTAVDLNALATAAYLIGRDDAAVEALQRAHRAYRDAHDVPHAVRCAYCWA